MCIHIVIPAITPSSRAVRGAGALSRWVGAVRGGSWIQLYITTRRRLDSEMRVSAPPGKRRKEGRNHIKT